MVAGHGVSLIGDGFPHQYRICLTRVLGSSLAPDVLYGLIRVSHALV